MKLEPGFSGIKTAIIKSLKEDMPKSITAIKSKFKSIPRENILYPLIFYIGSLIYLEIVSHLFIYNTIDGKIIYPIIFAIPLGFLFTLLTGFFDRFANILIMWVLTGLSCIIFCLQVVYYSVFKVYFSFQTMGMANEALTDFSDDVNIAIKSNLLQIFLLILPLAALYFLIKKVFLCQKRELKQQGYLFIGVLAFHLLALVSLPIYGKADYTPYDLYHYSKVPELSGRHLGIMTLTRFDIAGLIKGDEEPKLIDVETDIVDSAKEYEEDDSSAAVSEADTKTSPSGLTGKQAFGKQTVQAGNQAVGKQTGQTGNQAAGNNKTLKSAAEPTLVPVDTSPNIMDIDFEELAKNEDNKAIRTLHEYFATVTPTNKNKYTGMFKGYNLINIVAEGFSPYAVDEKLTPTLYKLTREGFVFTNFYTALWQTSTSDGEYVDLTGLIPVGTRSMYRSRNNLLPFALGKQFNLLGVESKAYHNHSYTYYERNETHPNLGYIFKAKGNGLKLESDVWPASDWEMIKNTVDEYIDEEQFHVYYLTVSGHMNYTFAGNSMSYKNKDLVKDLPYSSDAKAYIACQIELDRALEELIKRLTEAGVADRTVIALSADHYPYGWEKEKLDELAGHEVDPVFEVYRNYFILWCPAIKSPIIIDKPASSLDILPTLSNLFGLTYDSRLLMGRDILSDAEPLVILGNRSFITDKVMYNSETGKVIKLTNEELPKDYVKNINHIIKIKFTVSKSILKYDYYRYVFPDYPYDFIRPD